MNVEETTHSHSNRVKKQLLLRCLWRLLLMQKVSLSVIFRHAWSGLLVTLYDALGRDVRLTDHASVFYELGARMGWKKGRPMSARNCS